MSFKFLTFSLNRWSNFANLSSLNDSSRIQNKFYYFTRSVFFMNTFLTKSTNKNTYQISKDLTFFKMPFDFSTRPHSSKSRATSSQRSNPSWENIGSTVRQHWNESKKTDPSQSRSLVQHLGIDTNQREPGERA